MSNSDSEQQSGAVDFGSALAETRKAKNYSVEQVSENLKIPEKIIEAIENSDLDALPIAIYTQGYIRAYAKFLEMPEDEVLGEYNRAAPHDSATELRPRSRLPGEASSQSPLVKMVTLLLIVMGVFAIGYGLISYYQEKAGDMNELHMAKESPATGSSLDSPSLSSADTATGDDDSDELLLDELEVEEAAVGGDMAPASSETGVPAGEDVPVATDTLEIYAEKGAWLEVYDDTNARLFYNMVKKGDTRTLSGQAPFRIKVGNADVTRVMLNGIEVDLSGYTRPNNTAVFTVSERDGDIVYH